MARSETRVLAGAGPPDLRDVILLSSSPVLPPTRPLSTLTTTDASRLSWRDRNFDLPLLSSDPPEAAARSGAPPVDAHSKYFANSPSLPSSLPAAPSATVDLPPIPKEKAAQYVSGDLEHAVQRRRDWTPPPIDTAISTGEFSRSPHHVDDWSSSPGELIRRSNGVFKSLQTSFGCKEDDGQPSNTSAATIRESSFTKRKAIEAISIGDAGRAAGTKTSPTKTKAPKKKVRTLTELAVAAYADSTVEGGDTTSTTSKTTSKRQLDVVDENLPLAEPEVRPGLPMSKLRKFKTARAATAAKKPRAKKAPAPRKPVLLSPESARAAATRQDFLFGTSSQLAREQSPTFLRHLHTAMQASNQDADEPEMERNRLLDIIAGFDSDITPDISTVDLTGQRTPGPLEKDKKKQLWGAAARGEDGHLTFDNVIDLEDAIEFPEDPHQVIAMAQRAAKEAIQKEAEEKEPLAPTPAGAAATLPKQSARGKGKQPTKAKTTAVSSTALPVPPPTQKEAKVSKASKAKAAKAAKEKEVTRPNFEVLTTAQLTKKVSDYGYKTIKARSAMVALLNECWDAQHPNASPAEQPPQTDPASTAPPTVQAKDATAPATALTTIEPAKTQPKAKAPRVTKPKVIKPTQAAQSTIRGLTTSPRAALFLPKGTTTSPNSIRTATIHTTAKATAKATAKSSAKATATAVATSQARKVPEERIVFEIDDSESDGRFSSPEPVGSGRGLQEDIAVDEDDIVATDLDEDDDDMDNNMDNDEADMSLADGPLTYEESELFRYIATAVTSAPPTNDPTAPSWHEKILMYDTIILETFTAWLNDGPLRTAGYAGVDVAPADVKKWCESKSVCCTWRKNLQGKERKW